MKAIDDRDNYQDEFNKDGYSLDDIFDRPIGLTALMHACKDGYSDIAQPLLSKEAGVDRRYTKKRYTSLMMALCHNHLELVELLMSEGEGAEVTLVILFRPLINSKAIDLTGS